MIAAGAQTSALPMPGIIDNTVMTVPQKIAPSMPTTQNASPPITPCAMPVRIVPLSVARVTETNWSSMRSFVGIGDRQVAHDALEQRRARP